MLITSHWIIAPFTANIAGLAVSTGLQGMWASINDDTMVVIKGCLAGAGALLLIWDYWLAQRGRQQIFRHLRDSLLATFGLIALAAWWNFGHFTFDYYVNWWEQYHYYIGAKYHPEIGYTRLYVCTGVAEVEDGFRERVADRPIRNLQTNELENSESIIADPSLCKRYFTPERWNEFKRDIAYFSRHFDTEYRWNWTQKDHGYNATPVWGIAGGVLASLVPASDRGILCLALLDPLLLLVMWAVVWWAFGWRTMCVALLYWGCNFPARYFWNGGGYLRMDWLAAAIIGICLLKREHFAGGGFALTYSALLRIFPGFILLGIVAKAIARWLVHRTDGLLPPPPAHGRCSFPSTSGLRKESLWPSRFSSHSPGPAGAASTGGSVSR